jgi:hypothetical protein
MKPVQHLGSGQTPKAAERQTDRNKLSHKHIEDTLRLVLCSPESLSTCICCQAARQLNGGQSETTALCVARQLTGHNTGHQHCCQQQAGTQRQASRSPQAWMRCRQQQLFCCQQASQRAAVQSVYKCCMRPFTQASKQDNSHMCNMVTTPTCNHSF